MESTDASVVEQQQHRQQPQLPPGFRFHPTDEELVVHYLMRRAQSAPLPISIIAEVDLYKFDPWELPEKAVFGEHEWYFFSPRDRKYPNGARPNRAATSGYWKATGTDKPIFSSAGNKKVGVKKALVFYGGKPPRGHKTNWIMHEYRLLDNNNSNSNNNKSLAYSYNSNNKKGSLRLDDWVLCRIYKKNSIAHRPTDDHQREETVENMMTMAIPNSINSKSSLTYINTSHDDQGICLQGMNGNQQGMQVDPAISMVPPSLSSLATNLPLKRALPSLYWGGDSSSKKLSVLQDDDNEYNNNNNNNNNSTEVLHQQTLLGALSEGVFRQPYQVPGLNWYT